MDFSVFKEFTLTYLSNDYNFGAAKDSLEMSFLPMNSPLLLGNGL